MRRYILTHWRGEQELLVSSLINGILIYVVLVASLVSIGQLVSSRVFTFGGIVVFVLWMIWAAVGNFRCGIRNALAQANGWGARLGGVIVVVGVLLVGFFSIKDVTLLLGLGR